MPEAATAKEVTGYERGTITPFGANHPWPVIADERVRGHLVSIGGGAHGVAATVDGDALTEHVRAQVADVTEPAGRRRDPAAPPPNGGAVPLPGAARDRLAR